MRFTISRKNIRAFIRADLVKRSDFVDEDIKDQAKVDTLGKLFTVVQSAWTTCNTITRAAYSLPISPLELVTVAVSHESSESSRSRFPTYTHWPRKYGKFGTPSKFKGWRIQAEIRGCGLTSNSGFYSRLWVLLNVYDNEIETIIIPAHRTL